MHKLSFGSGFQRLSLALSLLLGACAPGVGPADEQVGSAQGAVFTNGDFETGAQNVAPPSWTLSTYLNPNNSGITVQSPQTRAGLNLGNGGTPLTVTLQGSNQSDPDMGVLASLRYCRYGSKCVVVNRQSSSDWGHDRNVNGITQTMTIADGDVDSVDGQVHVRFVFAPVLQNPGHPANQQPYYFAQLTNTTTSTVLYTDFNLSAQAGVPWKTITPPGGEEINYVDWTLVDIAPGAAKIKKGDVVQLEIIAAGCALGGHFGEVYVDGVGSTIPGLFVSGVGPAQVNAGSPVTYNMTYRNGSSAAETGVVINFTTPPNTTFQTLTPPTGAICTTPLVGAAGTITCTLSGPLAAAASGTFAVTVNLSGSATGTLVCGQYDIRSTQETVLNGPKIVTTIGCAADADCAAGKWCNISAKQCTATLPNGTTIPVDGLHSNPTLNGTCSVAAGALVCQAAVCDTDDKCGKVNGNGTCTVANQATICRSGVCDPDGLCGYATDHGPCTAGNATTVCRSGLCSANLLCKPAGGCNVDADCTGGNWCNASAHTCTAKLSNGTVIPTDLPHTNPILNGNCSTAAGSLVCQSAVCDTTDNKCGYAVNGGPCSAGNASTVCRSGSCSANLLCRPASGCNVDADCASNQWCNEASHVCTAKLANGTTIPVDVPHTNPTLNGTCTVAAGSLVCQAAVCDTRDDKCGKLNGSGTCTTANQATICRSGVCDAADGVCGYDTNHGPCSAANAATVCRSGACSANLLCQPAGGCNVDSDCTAGKWCNETSHTCAVKLTNGTSIPTDAPHANPTLNGACTTAAATLICQSAVCDSGDDKCGYDVNHGPCSAASAATVCRTGSCSANLLCQPAGGCNVDADCTSGNWCNETLHACTPTLANNTAIPTDAPHTNPSLSGVCTSTAGALVCQSAVCDTADDKCGFDNGHGPCTTVNAAVVCRSGACSADGKCRPASGCNLDADCATGNWCEVSTRSCKPTLANGTPLPTDVPHTVPTLDGKCSEQAAALVCQSSVCDYADNQCGFATGHGPCTVENGAVVCRSGACSANGLCQPADGCNVDADCAAGKWCNVSTGACLPRLGNGLAIPSDPPHVGPTLDGSCTDAAATLVCVSGVCDTHDNECGFGTGIGPCSTADAGSVCRSGHCGTTGAVQGTCVDCSEDAHCSGATPVCNAKTGACVECTSTDACSGKTPICDVEHSLCVKCNGDNGSKASNPCPSAGSPFCSLSGSNQGSCGKCGSDADCAGHSGTICDTTSGLCKSGCNVDADCSNREWCNDDQHICTAKLPNGTPLPGTPERVAKCTADIGSAVCQSAVCDPVDDTCGLAEGNGPCEGEEQCRAGSCNTETKLCQSGCTSNADCSTTQYCAKSGACQELLPVGAQCESESQCRTHDCRNNVCSSIVASGAGVACATRSVGGSGADWGAGFVLALIGVAASARRRRATRSTRAAA